MRFDWRRFCDRHHIPYVTAGANTARGNISIHCPFCGAADPSEHLGLKLDVRNPKWGCFRNATHGGSDPTRLVAKLLNVSLSEAGRLVNDSAPPIDDFEQTLELLRCSTTEPSERATNAPELFVPSEFKLLAPTLPEQPSLYQQRFLDYLAMRRGFGADAADVAHRYQLWYALTGPQAWRLIFPVLNADKLIGWTGREIRDGAEIRYRAREEMGKDWLLTSPRKEPADVLVVCEGPLDYLKIDYYGRQFGVEAAATMGTAVTSMQLAQLVQMQRHKRKMWALFDAEAFTQNMRLASDLSGFRSAPKFHRLPAGYGDPGEMSAAHAREFCRLLAR